MDLTWSLEEVARTSDEAAVRARFFRRNRVWLLLLLGFFLLVSFIEIVDHSSRKTPFDILLAAFHMGLTAFSLFLMRYTWKSGQQTFLERAGGWIRSHMSAVALVSVAVQYTLALILSRRADAWVPWTILFPMMMIGFRMLVAELVLLHAFLAGGGLFMPLLAAEKNQTGAFVAMLVVNVMCVGAELFASSRMRRQVVGDFTSRRTQAREQLRMRDELRYARELQLSMLPECDPRLPWADICSTSIPATEVGGDYYDYFVDGDRIALVCGDVAGHGMASGLVLSAIRSGFTLLRDSLSDPAAVLTRLHDLVAHTTRRRMLVTVSVVLVDHATGQATVASAGHPPVILRRADGSLETLDLFAPPLGVRLPLAIPQRRFDVAAGDTFVLHSDGIYEAHDASGDSYGMERLEQAVREHGGGTAEQLRNGILADVAAFRGAVDQADDVTLVVCRLL